MLRDPNNAESVSFVGRTTCLTMVSPMHVYLVNPTPHLESTPSLAHRLASGLINIGLALNSHARKAGGAHGLGSTQNKILAFLRQCPKQSGTLSAIAEGLTITPATACESIRTLDKKGFIRKVRSEVDARVVTITLSPKGRRKADHSAGQLDFLIAAAERLAPAEQEVFFQTLLKMMLVIQERSKAPASRVQRVNGRVRSRPSLTQVRS